MARPKKRHLCDIHGKKLNLKCQHCGHVSHTFCTLYLHWNDAGTMLEQCWNDAGHVVIHYMYAVNDILPSIIRASFQHYLGVIQKIAFYYL